MALDYLPTPNWAVVYGEVPSASKWSQLGTNDNSLATGAGVDNLAILTRHLNAKAVTEAKIDLATLSKIRTQLTSNHTITSSTTTIPFSTTNQVDGTLLTRSGNNVVIGAGVARVRVSWAIMVEAASGSPPYLYAGITKNGTRISNQIAPFAGQFSAVSETLIVAVAQNDTIAVVADSGGGSCLLSTGRTPHLEVEVIG